MARIEEIKHAIEELTEDEFVQLRDWLIEKEWENWDKEIERDSEEGKLDFLIKEAQKKKVDGKLRVL